jgi:O-methyltransferase
MSISGFQFRRKIGTVRRMLSAYVLYRHFGGPRRVRDQYLQLMQNCLTGSIYEDPPLKVLGREQFDAELREYGWDWPSKAHSMIGRKRMQNLRALAERVIFGGVPGDFIETGVWRGGACIFMRAILEAYGVRNRRVWLADSFEGLPPPDPATYPADTGDTFHTYTDLAVSIDDVKRNFEKYSLLDDQVIFLQGWFKDTLPAAPIGRLALLRLDGDMYESTIDALRHLYDKLSLRGFVIVDDYRVVAGCRAAVDDFRAMRGITDLIVEIDGVGVYWQKTAW